MKDKIIAIPTQKISSIVQQKLFDLGYQWCNGETSIDNNPNQKYKHNAYINLGNKNMAYGSRYFYLVESAEYYIEITMYDLFQMETDKVSITCEGKTIKISRESAKALNLI